MENPSCKNSNKIHWTMSKSIIYGYSLQFWTTFTGTMSRLQGFRQSIPLFNLNLEGLQPQLGERRQIHLHDQQLPAVLNELVKTDNVEEIPLVQATIIVAAHYIVKFKSNCNNDNFTKYEFLFVERGSDLPVEPKWRIPYIYNWYK